MVVLHLRNFMSYSDYCPSCRRPYEEDTQKPCEHAVDREVAAIAALQGILASSPRSIDPSVAAKLAVEYADALVKRLQE